MGVCLLLSACSDAAVYGSSNPLNPTKVKMQIKESSDKVKEGVSFMFRGLRLLGSDVANAGEWRSKSVGLSRTMRS